MSCHPFLLISPSTRKIIKKRIDETSHTSEGSFSLMMKSSWFFLLLMIPVSAYVPKAVREEWRKPDFSLEKAMNTIAECAKAGEENDDLYGAVRFIDRNAHHIYADPKEKDALMERAKGSWELRLAYEDSKSAIFFPYPDFREFAIAFIIVEDNYFGKGIAQNPNFSFAAMGGPAFFNKRTRQLYMNYEDFYISGNQVPGWDLSYFMRGYARNWYARERNRPPLAFTLIAANDDVLVVRGSKTGGMAILRRMKGIDMRRTAYGYVDQQNRDERLKQAQKETPAWKNIKT